MAKLVVLRRRNRCYEDHLQEDIWNLLTYCADSDLNCSYAAGDNPETIYSAFVMVAQTYCKYADRIQSHSMKLILNKQEIKDVYMAYECFEKLLDLIGSNYQVVLGITEDEYSYTGTYLFNSISYRNGSKFTDNNMVWYELKQWMETELNLETELSDEVIFRPNTENFIQ